MTLLTRLKCWMMIVFLAAGSVGLSAMDLTRWKYCSEITLEDTTAGYCRMDITPPIYDAARPDLSDLRIVDAAGQQVPYVLVVPRDTSHKQGYFPTVLNRVKGAQNSSLVTLDFGRQTVKNSIEVNTGGRNFRRAVTVEGSNDNVAFFTLVEPAFVFAIDSRDEFRFNTLDLPMNDYRYLRITVFPMADETDSPVIEDVQVFHCVHKPAARTPIEMVCTNQTEDAKNNVSVYEYDLGFCNLPINAMSLSPAADSFYRVVTIEGRNALKRQVEIRSEDNRQRFREIDEPWHSVTGGTIYRYLLPDGKTKENLTLPLRFGAPSYRYLKVTIKNYDDRPLVLASASAEMTAHKIVFPAAEDSSNLALYAGSDSASAPRYDISYKLANPLEVSALSGTFGPVAENPLFGKAAPKPAPWTEQHKTLLMGVMIIVVLVLGGFILKSFKSISHGTND